MNRKLGLLLTIVIALTLSACGSTGKKGSDAPTNQESTNVGDARQLIGTTGMTAEELAQYGIVGNPLDYTVLYFEYNSSAIDKRSEIIAGAHARELAGRGATRVTLEGHADERGTRDYNLALGERRAQTVANYMSSVGAGSSNVQTISYGEERPADPAHNESAWQKNRRVQINY